MGSSAFAPIRKWLTQKQDKEIEAKDLGAKVLIGKIFSLLLPSG